MCVVSPLHAHGPRRYLAVGTHGGTRSVRITYPVRVGLCQWLEPSLSPRWNQELWVLRAAASPGASVRVRGTSALESLSSSISPCLTLLPVICLGGGGWRCPCAWAPAEPVSTCPWIDLSCNWVRFVPLRWAWIHLNAVVICSSDPLPIPTWVRCQGQRQIREPGADVKPLQPDQSQTGLHGPSTWKGLKGSILITANFVFSGFWSFWSSHNPSWVYITKG